MHPTTYDGPRHGDYVRYVDELLRASPLYRSAALGWMDLGRSDFTGAASTPGAEPQSVVGRMRGQVQAAAERARVVAQQAAQAQAQAGRTPAGGSGGRKGERARPAGGARQETARAAGKSRFRLAPMQLVWIVVGLVLAMLIPGVGAFILLFTIINAVRNGIKAAR